MERDLIDLLRREAAGIDRELLQGTVFLHNGWPSDRKKQVGHTFAALHHGREKRIDNVFVHRTKGEAG